MSEPAHRSRRIESFLTLAQEEVRASATLMADNTRQAAYFQQQAIEKLLRAVLEAENVAVGPTHNIRTLADLLPTQHILSAEFLAFEHLSSAATRYRYPGGSGGLANPDRQKTERDQAEIADLLVSVEKFLAARR